MSDTPTTLNVSPTTLETFYSGESSEVADMMRQIETETGQVVENVSTSNVDAEEINANQEEIDRWLDDRLRATHKVPIYQYVVGTGSDKRKVFPGIIKEIAIMFTAVRILRSRLYDVNPQQSDSLLQYTELSEQRVRDITTGVIRIPGARRRGRSRTLPPNMEVFRDPVEVT